MATILLSAAGAAVGGMMGGSIMGLSSVVVGRFAGAVLGRRIDEQLLGRGAEPVETGRVDRLRLLGAGEGEAIARVHGRMRIAGQVIWATQFREEVTVSGGSGKGAARGATPERHDYTYSVSLAISLGEGEMTGVGRIWADGAEIDSRQMNWRFYPGDADQLPDPLIEAVEGAGQAPAFRGTAYVVIEDLALGPWGNRVPQFNFEVFRPAPADNGLVEDPARAIRAVAMLPGSGEYALSTQQVLFDHGAGVVDYANRTTPVGASDFEVSLDRLEANLPNCGSVSLIVSWFGDDLRCGSCTIRPNVEQAEIEAESPWSVAGVQRGDAQIVPYADDRPVYGGTPSDASVIEAIKALKSRGKEVMIYPFLMMRQMAGNGLIDPWTGEADQPVLPWRGRITTSLAPGVDGSPDGTALAEAEVAAFFGTASAADFAISPDEVSYSGPAEWGMRRFVLHSAALCAVAGGVEAFCIGSEMRALTQIRGLGGFPAVAALRDLAAEVRDILGPNCKIGYAADWSEYFGYQPQDGSGDRYFHLDPLWADQNIDFVGIDNYMPLSDWRDGEDHADAAHGSVYDLDYLMGNVAGGEGYDWYYPSVEAREAQRREPIEDGTHDEPWIWRYKDIRNWWGQYHHDRVGGQRQALPTDWVPQSKPIWFTELGCPAVDKGTNQPNKFIDPKSSESAAPHYSNGQRDDLIQMQYLRAMHGFWGDSGNNPQSSEYAGAMVDMSRAHVWAWDARPFPWFPARDDIWGDGENYARGHWVTGRAGAQSLASVVAEICGYWGLHSYDVSDLRGLVWGYVEPGGGTARQALQPLMLRYGFDAVDRDGVLAFVMRDGRADHLIRLEDLAEDGDLDGLAVTNRAGAAEQMGQLRVQFVEAEGDYETRLEEARLPGDTSDATGGSELPLAMRLAEGRAVAERWLSEAVVARDTIRFALPPSRADVRAGDVVQFGAADLGGASGGGQLGPEAGYFRVDGVERAGRSLIDAVRIDPEIYRAGPLLDTGPQMAAQAVPGPVFPLFLDLPLITGQEAAHAPHIALTAEPWPGTAAVYISDEDADYRLDRTIGARSIIGGTETALPHAPGGLVDRGARLELRLTSGDLASISDLGLLNGRNLCAIGDGSAQGWELFQFRDAEVIGPGRYALSHLLRGQLGTDADMPATWPAGSFVVVMDGTPEQIGLLPGARGYERHLRVGPASQDYSDPSYLHDVKTFLGIGLRPYAPAHLTITPAQNGDLTLGWVRRTRVDGDSWDLPDVPLNEAREAYQVRILRGGDELRSVEVTDPFWTYPAATVADDGGAAGLEIRVSQISDLYGPGAEAWQIL